MRFHVKHLILAVALLAPLPALAQQAPQVQPSDLQQAGTATAADLAGLVVNLRAQLLADQREIASLQQQIATAKAAPKLEPPK
jgi:hypothetical protein